MRNFAALIVRNPPSRIYARGKTTHFRIRQETLFCYEQHYKSHTYLPTYQHYTADNFCVGDATSS